MTNILSYFIKDVENINELNCYRQIINNQYHIIIVYKDIKLFIYDAYSRSITNFKAKTIKIINTSWIINYKKMNDPLSKEKKLYFNHDKSPDSYNKNFIWYYYTIDKYFIKTSKLIKMEIFLVNYKIIYYNNNIYKRNLTSSNFKILNETIKINNTKYIIHFNSNLFTIL
jgi:hypothetical protein